MSFYGHLIFNPVSSQNIAPPFIESINVPDNIVSNQEISLTLTGNWPTPNWSHHKTDVDVSISERTVEIEYVGMRSPGMAMQVLKAFSDTVKITFPKAGEWKIIVWSKSGKITQRVDVKD